MEAVDVFSSTRDNGFGKGKGNSKIKEDSRAFVLLVFSLHSHLLISTSTCSLFSHLSTS